VSVADIEADGPFSAFPGVARWFTVVEGAGVELTIGDIAHCLRAGDAPLAFDGAASTTCQLLAGATRDLNLMLRGRAGSMSLARHALPWWPELECCGLYTATPGRCVFGSDDQRIELSAHTLLWFDEAPTRIRFDADEASAAPAGWWLSVGALEHR
jgi:environmental stress-induced protein Ves